MANVFECDLGEQAIKRLKTFGRTNIRYSFVEMYGVEKLQEDLTEKVGSPCTVRVGYDTHQPMDMMRYVYCGDTTYTIRIPVMPVVILEIQKKKK